MAFRPVRAALLAALLAGWSLATLAAPAAAEGAAGGGIVASYDADTDTSYLVARPTLGEPTLQLQAAHPGRAPRLPETVALGMHTCRYHHAWAIVADGRRLDLAPLGEGFVFHRPVRPRCLNYPVGVLISRATFAALATAQSVVLHMEGKAFTFGAADRALLRDFSARIEALRPPQEAAPAAPARTGPDVFPADPS